VQIFHEVAPQPGLQAVLLLRSIEFGGRQARRQ